MCVCIHNPGGHLWWSSGYLKSFPVFQLHPIPLSKGPLNIPVTFSKSYPLLRVFWSGSYWVKCGQRQWSLYTWGFWRAENFLQRVQGRFLGVVQGAKPPEALYILHFNFLWNINKEKNTLVPGVLIFLRKYKKIQLFFIHSLVLALLEYFTFFLTEIIHNDGYRGFH